MKNTDKNCYRDEVLPDWGETRPVEHSLYTHQDSSEPEFPGDWLRLWQLPARQQLHCMDVHSQPGLICKPTCKMILISQMTQVSDLSCLPALKWSRDKNANCPANPQLLNCIQKFFWGTRHHKKFFWGTRPHKNSHKKFFWGTRPQKNFWIYLWIGPDWSSSRKERR